MGPCVDLTLVIYGSMILSALIRGVWDQALVPMIGMILSLPLAYLNDKSDRERGARETKRLKAYISGE